MAQTRAQKAAAASKAAAATRKAAQEQATHDAASAAPSAPAAPKIKQTGKVGGENKSFAYVASKITRGLYLDIFKFTEMTIPGPNGARTVISPMRLPDRIRIKPAILGFGLVPNYPMESGFSITKVPADHWRMFVEQNPNFGPIVEEILKGFDTEADARAFAREYAEKRTGLEPLKQEGDERIQTSMNGNVGDVEIDDETPRPKQFDQKGRTSYKD